MSNEAPNLTPAGVAEMLGVSAETVSRWADDGVLPFFRTPGGHRRFRRSDVRSLLERNTTAAVEPEVAAS